MANLGPKRLNKELAKISSSLPPGITLVSADNLEEWFLDIQVLDQNPIYAGQTYRLKFKFGTQYPIEPPEVTFVKLDTRPIPMHPHIYSNGIICLDLLGTQGWSPVQNVESVCMSLQSMKAPARSSRTSLPLYFILQLYALRPTPFAIHNPSHFLRLHAQTDHPHEELIMAPHAGFDPEQIRDKARKDLLYLLEGVRGKKNLVIERSLAGPIGVVVKVSTLQDYGVDKFFFLENGNADTSQRNVVFMARGECARHAQSIADQIKRLQRESQTGHEFHVFWVPRRTLVSDKLLEEAGVLGDVNIAELPLYFFPLERDVLSLELESSFQDLFLFKDTTPTFLMAKALMGIQTKHGLFPRVIGKGDNAKRVTELLTRMRQEILAGEDANEGTRSGLTPSNTIESVIIIDREVDFVTPLLTQLTYEGLIDELWGIQNNQADIDSTIVGAPPQATSQSTASAPTPSTTSRKRKIQLDSSDRLYDGLRDANFAIVGTLLNKVARRLQSDYDSRHASKTTAELKDFVKKLPGYQTEHQSLKVHTGLAEEIMKHTRADQFSRMLEVQQNLAAGTDPSSQFDAIEELIARDVPLREILRLLCIYSCISGGIKSKDFDQFRRLVLEGYGYQHLLTLHNLEKLQLFLSRTSPMASMIPMPGSGTATGTKTNYTYLRKQLRLIVDEVNEHDPNDIAYVYSGYAPLSIRLVQCILQKQYLLSITRGNTGAGVGTAAGGGAQGWRGFDEAVKHARGQTFDEVQKGEDKAVKARALLSGGSDKKTVFVVFVGGITFTEIAALRFIAKKEEARRNIVICTTSIISGNKMMDAAVEKESFAKEAPKPTASSIS
ncbi:small conjugating protein ligase-like protein [Rostrohypoxylon terebratum]|nr:small conjugating protein ligase-like protein [Rostrohypoxylon terebratum]